MNKNILYYSPIAYTKLSMEEEEISRTQKEAEELIAEICMKCDNE